MPTKRLRWRQVGCALKATAWCQFGRGFTIVESDGKARLVGMGLHFGSHDSVKAAKAAAQRTYNQIQTGGYHPVAAR